MNNLEKTLLKVSNLAVSFDTVDGTIDAVQGINFELNKGQTLAIIGESGSGKA
jgi:oligopeptide transport system ATP-binding protein